MDDLESDGGGFTSGTLPLACQNFYTPLPPILKIGNRLCDTQCNGALPPLRDILGGGVAGRAGLARLAGSGGAARGRKKAQREGWAKQSKAGYSIE